MNAVTNNSLDEQLQGLLFPPQSSAVSWELMLLLLLISLLVMILTIWLYRKHIQKPAIVAIKQLNILQQSTHTDLQSTALKITHILRQGLQVTRLDSYHPPEKQQWDSYKSILDKACYSTNTKLSNLPGNELQHLIKEAEIWLLQAIKRSRESK
jgi:hypothetical protein